MSKWIYTDDKLPEKAGFYLVSYSPKWSERVKALTGWGAYGDQRVFSCYFENGAFRAPMRGDVPPLLRNAPLPKNDIDAWQKHPEPALPRITTK